MSKLTLRFVLLTFLFCALLLVSGSKSTIKASSPDECHTLCDDYYRGCLEEGANPWICQNDWVECYRSCP
jgi:hypothetical protein